MTPRLPSPHFKQILPPLLAIFATTCPLHAQISLRSAAELAQRNDPRIRVAQADVKKAEASLEGTTDAYIPTAGISAGYGTSTGVPLGVPVVFQFSSNSLLFNFSQRDYARAASSGLRAATLSLQDARERVTEDVVLTYLNLDSAQRRVSATGEEYGYAGRLVSIVQDRLDAGQDNRVDLLHAQKTAHEIHLAQLHAEDETADLSDHLARLLGLPGTPLVTVPDSIPAMPDVAAMVAGSTDIRGEGPAVAAAVASARSKQETAFGMERYRFRPQLAFGLNYAYIDTSHTNYDDYYPGFKAKSNNAASVGLSIQVPLYDRGHESRAHEAAADAIRATAEADSARAQFLEGRYKLRHGNQELAEKVAIASLNRDLAAEQVQDILIQLNGTGPSTGTPLTPKDEQNARIQERARFIDILTAEADLRQAQVNLMRQTGQLEAWLRGFTTGTSSASLTTTKP